MKLFFKSILLISIFILISNQLHAQFKVIVKKDSLKQDSFLFTNRMDQQQKLMELISDSKKHGFYRLLVENDSLNSNTSTVSLGKKISFYIENIKSNDSMFLVKNLKLFSINKNISFADLNKSIDKALILFENSGHPFAKINILEKNSNDSTLNVDLQIDKGNIIRYDSIDIKGNSKISRAFMAAYLGIKKGRLYNESEIQLINKRLSTLTFIQTIKSPEIAFIEQKTRLILYLNKRNSSQFDGIIGLLPQSGDNQKTLITGEIKLNLLNTLNNAEHIELSWRRTDPLSQDLIVGLSAPYIAGTPYGGDFKFKLIKKDTTTITTTFHIGGNYYFSGMNNLKAYFEQTTSSMLSVTSITSASSLSQNIDYKIQRYGLATSITNLDDLWIPTHGYKLDFDVNIGSRIIIKNSKIPSDYYVNIPESETQIKETFSFDFYQRVAKKLVFNFSNRTNYISGNSVYENEMFRFGGLNSLRGFNEESLMASFLCMSNTELRWLIDKKTYLFIFWNGAYYEKKLKTKFVHDTPNGFGAGLSFDTPAGIFNITYALGKEFNNPIQFKYGKIHFGIVARF